MKILEALDKITKELNNSNSRDNMLKDNLLDLWYIYSIGEAVEKGVLDNIELDSIDSNITKTIKNMLNKLEKTNTSTGKNVDRISNIEEINGKKCGNFTLKVLKGVDINNVKNGSTIVKVMADFQGTEKEVYSNIVIKDWGYKSVLEDLKVFGFYFEIKYKKVEIKDGDKVIGTMYCTDDYNILTSNFINYKLVDINNLLKDTGISNALEFIKILKSIYKNLKIEDK